MTGSALVPPGPVSRFRLWTTCLSYHFTWLMAPLTPDVTGVSFGQLRPGDLVSVGVVEYRHKLMCEGINGWTVREQNHHRGRNRNQYEKHPLSCLARSPWRLCQATYSSARRRSRRVPRPPGRPSARLQNKELLRAFRACRNQKGDQCDGG
jgi:hypothetical protein